MTDVRATGIDDYVMGRTSAEYQRLRRQAAMWEPATRRVLRDAGVKPGMRCLDVGCGPGEVMRIMGEIVGPSGSVTGLDTDGRLGREALDVLRATGDSTFDFIEGNAETIADLPGAPFDVTYARLVLIHSSDPVGLLRRMHAWTRPGGLVVVQDYDLGGVAVYPEYETFPEFMRVFEGVYKAVGRDIRIGYKLPVYFVEAGMGAPDGTDVTGILAPIAEEYQMFAAVYRSVLPRALEAGLTTEAVSEAFLRDTMRAGTEGPFRSALSPLLISVWKLTSNT